MRTKSKRKRRLKKDDEPVFCFDCGRSHLEYDRAADEFSCHNCGYSLDASLVQRLADNRDADRAA